MSDGETAERTTGTAGGRRYRYSYLVVKCADDSMETTMESMQTESSGKLAALNKCAHPGCSCTVSEGEQYCSDYCVESARADSAKDIEGCECGHAECTAVGATIARVG